MKIYLEFVGYLKLEGAENRSQVEVPNGVDVSSLFKRFKVSEEHLKFIVPVVNGERKSINYRLKDGDSLYLMLPVGGGAMCVFNGA
ncbi:MAG: hypothetical protein DRP87_04370 [Spirochaetes bacterium]|nr:MAG: hypothetical protein DRP87_04370 [Spirochaetota bacterium]